MLVSVHTTQIWSIHSMHATKSRGFANDGISPYPYFPFRLYLEYYCFIFIKHLCWCLSTLYRYEVFIRCMQQPEYSVCQCIIIFVCITWIHLILFCCNYNHIFLVCMAQKHCFMPVINLSILLNGIWRDYGYFLLKMIFTYQAFIIHVEHLNSNFMYILIMFEWFIVNFVATIIDQNLIQTVINQLFQQLNFSFTILLISKPNNQE